MRRSHLETAVSNKLRQRRDGVGSRYGKKKKRTIRCITHPLSHGKFPFCWQPMNDLGWNIKWRGLKFATGSGVNGSSKSCGLPETWFESFCYLAKKWKERLYADKYQTINLGGSIMHFKWNRFSNHKRRGRRTAVGAAHIIAVAVQREFCSLPWISHLDLLVLRGSDCERTQGWEEQRQFNALTLGSGGQAYINSFCLDWLGPHCRV